MNEPPKKRKKDHMRRCGKAITDYQELLLSCLEQTQADNGGEPVTARQIADVNQDQLQTTDTCVTTSLRRLQLELPAIRGERRRIISRPIGGGGKKLLWGINRKQALAKPGIPG